MQVGIPIRVCACACTGLYRRLVWPGLLQDHPVPIGWGQTISAPHMHATALELLKGHLAPGARALDVGSGETLHP